MSQSFPELKPKIILGIGAHPDDLDVGAGGTIAKYAEEGAEVHFMVLTDGSKGSEDPTMSSSQLIELRHDEQRNALNILGGKSVSFLDYPDGELEVTMELKKEIVKVIRTVRPDVVITMDPTFIYSAKNGIVNHPDHRAAGQAVLDSVFPLARDRLAFPDLEATGYKPHKTPTILLINFDKGNFSVDITSHYEKKVAAIKAHPSQFGYFDDTTWLRPMAVEQGKMSGYELAESFMRIDIK
jgi:LmbE family N-acetylglucosaminyl deacetylase